MKEQLKQYLLDNNYNNLKIPEILQLATDSISNDAPYKMKLIMALTELLTFISHFRKHIELLDGTEVPINTISICLAKSGQNKDSSLSSIKRALKLSYKKLEQYRNELELERALKEQEEKGLDKLNLRKLAPLQTGLGTPEGLVKHLNRLQDTIGAGYIMANEIATELISNPNLLDLIKVVSALYDLGHLPVKLLKTEELEVEEIDSMPMNAMLFGSEDAILTDIKAKEKFKLMFSSQLARRSLFYFNQEESKKEIKDINELLKIKRELQAKAILSAKELEGKILEVAKWLTELNSNIKLSEEANDLFNIYLEYNSLLSEDMSMLYPLAKLSRKHKQWLSLKISGFIAIINKHDQITKEDYITAVNIIELYAKDLENFEKELQKDKYEMFVDYAKTLISKNESNIFIDTHTIIKLGYLPSRNTQNHLEDLITNANSYDKNGIYTIVENGIQYTITNQIINEEDKIFGASYKIVEGTKQERATKVKDGFIYKKDTFEKLKNLLCNDLAFSPFKFKEGIRGNDKIDSGTRWVCLDIDDCIYDYEYIHNILKEFNHHIALTSNPEIKTKFRLIIELDTEVNVNAQIWKEFVKLLGLQLAIKVDPLPQSQIYYGFKDREVLSVIDKKPITTKPLLLQASDNCKPKPVKSKIQLNRELKEVLEEPLDKLWYLYEAKTGERSLNFIKAVYHLASLGATKEQIEEIIYDANSYIIKPLNEKILQQTIINQIEKVIKKVQS